MKCFSYIFVGLFVTGLVFAEDQVKVGKRGPIEAELGDQAKIKLGKDFIFYDGDETRAWRESGGASASGLEVGTVFAIDGKDSSWVMIFEYEDSGYVKDDEKNELDAAKLLQSYKDATKAQNERRKELNMPPLKVIGWSEKPHYDSKTNNLVWCLLGESAGRRFVNYNMRLLGREGYMSVVLITGEKELKRDKLAALKLLKSSFSYVSGKKYAEYKDGDKVAEYGLIALVAGGAGIAAAKLGLFALLGKFMGKFWKFVVAGVVAVGAGIKKLWFGGNSNKDVEG